MVSEHDIPPSLIINIDPTLLSYVNTEKCTFSFKGPKSILIKGVDDKRQITAILLSVAVESFCQSSLPKYSFSPSFSVTFTENHRSNTEDSVQFFKEIIFPYLEDTKRSRSYPLEQYALIIMDTFKAQDDILKKLCAEKNCDVVIVPHNLTNKF